MFHRHLLDFKNDTLFFLHIPKTGGTTLLRTLESFYTPLDICPIHYPQQDFATLLNDDMMQVYRFFRGHLFYNIIQKLPPPVYTITFLRNPITRTISHYYQYQRAPEMALYSKCNQYSLDRILDEPDAIHEFTNVATYYLSNGTMDYELAIDNLYKLSYIGITERYDESIALLSNQFHLPSLLNYQSFNITPSQQHETPIKPQTLEKLHERNHADLKLYQAATALFSQRYNSFLNSAIHTHYLEDRFFIDNPNPMSTIEINFSTIDLSASGWHEAEHNATQQSFRWSGSSTVSSLHFHMRQEYDYQLTFVVSNAISFAVLDSLQVMCNDQWLALERAYLGNSEYRFDTIIYAPMVKNFRGRVSLSFVISHVDTSEQDNRLLGLAYNWLRLKPQ